MEYDKETLVKRISRDLGKNYTENDYEVLIEIFEEVSSIASDVSNRKETDIKLFPHIKKAVKAMYLSRGAEGMTSRGEGSVSSSFEDIIERLTTDIIQSGLRRIK